jgi:ABC-type lipoprotein export system ATPase subunit
MSKNPTKPKSKKPVLSLTGVTKDYVMGDVTLNILKDVSLTIYEGELVSIVGPSGSGKSTLLHIMGLLDKQTAGQVILAGEETTDLTENESAKLRNKHIGFIFQQFNLLNRTSALENVLLPTLYNDVADAGEHSRGVALLDKLGLGDRINNKPNQLSGGQQQRVAIARALINDPAIVFADEPTGNLDQKSGHEVVEIIRDLHREGRTIVIVTHDMELAGVAQRRIRILDGEIVEDKYL